jgi:hypothetical protein
MHLEAFPNCAACGGTSMLEVHHIVPISRDRMKELDPDNLITLCEGNMDHFVRGHLCDWRSFNGDVVEDAHDQLNKIRNRP